MGRGMWLVRGRMGGLGFLLRAEYGGAIERMGRLRNKPLEKK